MISGTFVHADIHAVFRVEKADLYARHGSFDAFLRAAPFSPFISYFYGDPAKKCRGRRYRLNL